MAATKQRPGRWYTSREAAKSFNGGIPEGTSDKDDRIDSLIAGASRTIEKKTTRQFLPSIATKEFDYQGVSQLVLGEDLLSVSSLLKDGTAISAANYFLYPLNALDRDEPYEWLELNFSIEAFLYNDTKQSAITLTGKWGFSELTRQVTTLSASYTASGASLTVTVSSLLDVGQILLVGSEYFFVKDVQAATVTVQGAMQGSTAADHASGAAVYIVDPDPDIQMACNIMVARSLNRSDGGYADRSGSNDTSVTYFKSLPSEVTDTLKEKRKWLYPAPRPMQRMAVIGRYGDKDETG